MNHANVVSEISGQIISKNKNNKTIRFSHGATNVTRHVDKSDSTVINISKLNRVLEVDTQNKVAIAESCVTMEKLVDECLKRKLVPKVVAEFPNITVGGAINGASLESSSFKYGQFNDCCFKYECILSNGQVISASESKNKDLFYGIPGSYGSLALVTQVSIELIQATDYINMEIIPVNTVDILPKCKDLCNDDKCDYIDGIIFSEKQSALIVGRSSSTSKYQIKRFSHNYDEWFYLLVNEAVQQNTITRYSIPIKDYLFRYDRGAFWMGMHSFNLFHMPFNRLTRAILGSFMKTKTMYEALHQTVEVEGFFIQDFYLPYKNAEEFLRKIEDTLAIYPIWICPLKPTKNPQYFSPHYLDTDLVIDFGIWGKPLGRDNSNDLNKFFEGYLSQLKGRKMLYAESYYTKEEFFEIYNFKKYSLLRKQYKAEQFKDLWERTRSVKNKKAKNKYVVAVKIGMGKVYNKLFGTSFNTAHQLK